MKTYLIYGCGRSGVAALNLIWNKKDVFYIFDKSKHKQKEMYELYKDKFNIFVLSKIEKDLLKNLTEIIISPSVSIYNKNILFAKSHGVRVISELELGYLKTKNKFMAITGTNGKTTTTKLLFDMMFFSNKKVELVGNIGIPVCEKISKRKTTFVCEVSSFQLEGCFLFKPHIASILNISYDHINRHRTFKKYIDEKFKIAKNMTSEDYLVLNKNNKEINQKIYNFSCHIYYFDINNKCLGTYLKNKDIYFFDGKKENKIANLNSTKLYGKHNYENILCAVCMAKLYGVKNKAIQKAIDNFIPYHHRMERFLTNLDVDYIDDSKATNIGATKVAIDAVLSNCHLLLGGSGKGYEFDEIFEDLNDNIKTYIAFGEMGEKIYNTAKKYGFTNVVKFKTLKEATRFAVLNSKPNDTVLLSPACASFDEFESYKDRGEKFKSYVQEFVKQKI